MRGNQASTKQRAMCVCVSVLYRNPNPWKDLDEIWHRGCPRGQEGSWGGFNLVSPTHRVWGALRGSGVPLEGPAWPWKSNVWLS